MEDTTLADAVLAVATKYNGKRLNSRQLEGMPTMHEKGHWSFDKGYNYTRVNYYYWDQTKGFTHQSFAAADGKTECIWSVAYVENQNACYLKYARSRNEARENLIANIGNQTTAAAQLNGMLRAKEEFRSHYKKLVDMEEYVGLNLAQHLMDKSGIQYGYHTNHRGNVLVID
jgi:hypothetical protein